MPLPEDIELNLIEEFGRSLMKPAEDRSSGITALQQMSIYVVSLVADVRQLQQWRPAIEQAEEGMRHWQKATHETAVQNEQLRAALEDLASFVREFADADDVDDIIPLETAERLLGRRPC